MSPNVAHRVMLQKSRLSFVMLLQGSGVGLLDRVKAFVAN